MFEILAGEKPPYLSRKKRDQCKQRRLVEVICGVPERVGAARFDDAGGSVAGRAAGVRSACWKPPEVYDYCANMTDEQLNHLIA